MSKRNFTLLIIVLVIALIVAFGFLYLNRSPNTPEDGGGTNFLSNFNPFGKSKPAPPVVTSPPDVSNTTPPEEGLGVKLTEVSSMPIAGFSVYQKERFKEIPIAPPGEESNQNPETKPKTTKPVPPPTEFVPALRYVARSSGNIYQTFADKIDERKFSTTIIPRVYEAYFGNKGESVIMRYLKEDNRTIATFAGSLPKEFLGGDTSESNEVKGSFLPDNISDISVSPDHSRIFYLLNIGDSVVGTTSGILGDKKVQIFDSPFTEWLSFWPNSKMITLTTKPSSDVPGYMYAIDPNKKDFNKILGDISGLTTLTSPNGKLTLYGNSSLSLNVYNISTGEITPLIVRTLPEKCTWNKTSTIVYCAVPKSISGALYPDAWYRGEVSFMDDVWKIDIENGNANIVLDPTSILGEGLDGIKLTQDENENYLFFVNKKDSYLWRLELN